MSSSSPIADLIASVLSRPNECGAKSIDFEQTYDMKLAFALTGLSRSELFSPFFPLHRLIASKLIDYFISIKNLSDLEKIARYGREKINSNLFSYAFTVAILNRSDTNNAVLYSMSPAKLFPDKFFPASTILKAIAELNTVPAAARQLIDAETISSETYPEARLEYMRHDIGLNVCYYFWLVTHQFEAVRNELVDLDRCGELWCYFHQQIIAHYNAERHCNGLLSVVPLADFNESVPEGIFPTLTAQNVNQTWAPRFDDTYIDDLYRPYEGLTCSKEQFQRWIDRICNAIELGEVIDVNGNKIPLNNEKGIDILGNILRSSNLSPNRKFYGEIAPMGHAFIAYCHDSENESYQSYGVMGEPATCMTDPLFYRWYARISRIIRLHKSQLPPYTKDELKFEGVKITSIHVEDAEGNSKNCLQTHWDHANFNLKSGLSNQPNGDVFVRIKHLQHKDFQYVIKVENITPQVQSGMVRLFMAQEQNTRGRKLIFEELRTLFIELDRFSWEFQSGVNDIVRKSTDSSVTIPSENYFQPEAMIQKINENTANNSTYCLTGWPSHLLIPKGTLEGHEFLLFAMVSKDDKMFEQQTVTDNDSVYGKCTKAFSYGGLLRDKYPDKRSMGFPFDRPASIETLTINNFLLENMKAQRVIIKFEDTSS